MRRAAPRLLAAALATGLALRCASGSNPNEPVRVTRDRSLVRNCVDLALVATDLDGDDGEKDMKKKTADLGGNVLLIYHEHSGGAFYCANPPAEVTIAGPKAPPPPPPISTPRPF
jgi:hypothetical protein